LRQCLQNGVRLAPTPVVGQTLEMIGDHAPAGQGGQQSLHAYLQPP
jgi:hypothetical protein